MNGDGGDEEDRTPDLGIANAALSQLSYVPTIVWMIPPLWSIPNRQPPPAGGRTAVALRQTQHPGCNAHPGHEAPMTQTGPPGFPDGPCWVREGSASQQRPFPAHAQDSLRPAASAASRRSSRAAACGWSAGRRWVRRQPRRLPGRSRGRCAPRLPGLPPGP